MGGGDCECHFELIYSDVLEYAIVCLMDQETSFSSDLLWLWGMSFVSYSSLSSLQVALHGSVPHSRIGIESHAVDGESKCDRKRVNWAQGEQVLLKDDTVYI